MTLNNQSNTPATYRPVIFVMGFRPFFLGAGFVAILTMAVWMLVYVFGWHPAWLGLGSLPAVLWHAHEMIYGYALAVIAGFLLTAVRNWTGLPTAFNRPLQILFACWFTARILMLFGPLELAAAFDIAFGLQLVFYIVRPIVKVRQWRQFGVVIVLSSLLAGNLLFYLGALEYFPLGTRLGIYFGFYLIIGMILIIGRRIIPTFIASGIIASGISKPITFPNLLAVDVGIAATYVVFLLNEVFLGFSIPATVSSSAMFLLCSIRILSWHHPAIWSKSLLWSLYVSYASLGIGFLLYALVPMVGLSPFLALHMMAIGTVAIITMSMMSRVSIGHTGRSIHSPPSLLNFSFILLCVATLFRVAGPIVFPQLYPELVLVSQVFWITAFGLFLFLFFPILTGPRIDGMDG